jgi:hypothetical protein
MAREAKKVMQFLTGGHLGQSTYFMTSPVDTALRFGFGRLTSHRFVRWCTRADYLALPRFQVSDNKVVVTIQSS